MRYTVLWCYIRSLPHDYNTSYIQFARLKMSNDLKGLRREHQIYILLLYIRRCNGKMKFKYWLLSVDNIWWWLDFWYEMRNMLMLPCLEFYRKRQKNHFLFWRQGCSNHTEYSFRVRNGKEKYVSTYQDDTFKTSTLKTSIEWKRTR